MKASGLNSKHSKHWGERVSIQSQSNSNYFCPFHIEMSESVFCGGVHPDAHVNIYCALQQFVRKGMNGGGGGGVAVKWMGLGNNSII